MNKIFNNKIKMIFLTCLFLMIALITFGCKDATLEDYINEGSEYISQVKEAKVTSKLLDNDILVYETSKEIKYSDGNKADVLVTTKSLNSSFELEEKTSNQYGIEVSKDSLMAFNCKNEYISNYLVEDDLITFTVNNDNIKKVLANDSLEIATDASFTLTVNKGKILSLTCSYETKSGRVVSIESTFSY